MDSLESCTPDALQQYPDVLKSFEVWMSRGPAAKSARGYLQVMSLLIRTHRQSIRAMLENSYYRWVLTSTENRLQNNRLSAGLKQFKNFISMRGGSVEPPWEQQALRAETQYHVVDRKVHTKKTRGETSADTTGSAVAPTTKQVLRKFFGIKRTRKGASAPSGNLNQEQLKRIEENRRAAMQKRQQLWLSQRQDLSPEEILRDAAEQRATSSKTKLTAEQLVRIEANRREALQRRQQRLRQEEGSVATV